MHMFFIVVYGACMHISMIYHFSFIKCPYSTGEQHLVVLGIVHTFMHLVVLGKVHTFKK